MAGYASDFNSEGAIQLSGKRFFISIGERLQMVSPENW